MAGHKLGVEVCILDSVGHPGRVGEFGFGGTAIDSVVVIAKGGRGVLI